MVLPKLPGAYWDLLVDDILSTPHRPIRRFTTVMCMETNMNEKKVETQSIGPANIL